MSRKLMLTSPGSYKNPSDRACWEGCSSCGRCEKKGSTNCPNPTNCSGRFDPRGMRHPHVDDFCDCKNGILRWVTGEGQLCHTKFLSNPFAGVVKYKGKSNDELDWENYLNDVREKTDDPDWDPIQIGDDKSAQRWLDGQSKGYQRNRDNERWGKN
jgi:hypothetical protein